MKLGLLVDQRFAQVLGKLNAVDIPVRAAFQLKSISKAAQVEITKFEELRKEIVTKNGVKKEDGSLDVKEDGTVQFDKDGAANFQREMNELVNIEVELPSIQLSVLGDAILLSKNDLDILDGVLVNY
jgi:hypothetical protein